MVLRAPELSALKSNMLILQDCLIALRSLSENSVDALVTDPPAGILFMGKSWDGDKGGRKQWIAWMTDVMQECLRVLKPGAHGLVWALPRTSHWTATALEDAGFEVRDVITHLFGSGFPKSSHLLNDRTGVLCQCARDKRSTVHIDLGQGEGVRKGMDQTSDGDDPPHGDAQHSTRIPSGSQDGCRQSGDLCDAPVRTSQVSDRASVQPQRCAQGHSRSDAHGDVPSCESSRSLSSARYSAHPSSLGCSSQKIVLACTPSSTQKSVSGVAPSADAERAIHRQNNQSFPWPTCSTCGKARPEGFYNGGLKPASEHWILIRKPCSEKTVAANVLKWGCGALNIDASRIETDELRGKVYNNNNVGWKCSSAPSTVYGNSQGRFPANLTLDEYAARMLDEQSGQLKSGGGNKSSEKMGFHGGAKGCAPKICEPSSGGASRFFYVAKASKAEKNAGLDTSVSKAVGNRPGSADMTGKFPDHDQRERVGNFHPTVKSQALMRYLIRMVTPPGGVVLDPFMGSGSTGVAAKSEGFEFIGIEKEKEYFEIAQARIS